MPAGPRHPNDCEITYYIDIAAKFHRSVVIKGWLSHPSGNKPVIRKIKALSKNILAATWRFIADMPHLGDFAGGFEIQLLLAEDAFPEDLDLVFEIDQIGKIAVPWADIAERIAQAERHGPLTRPFRALLKETGATNMLDIGGRARSGVLRASEFPELKVDVLDIMPGDGVTVVGDAHSMSTVLPPGSFDSVICVAVFEHLLMPWKVGVEMNRVMKMGAVGLVQSHQSLGLHDMPCDYLRFSDSAWKGIFNTYSGFEIIEAAMKEPTYLIPFLYGPRYQYAEQAAGYAASAVLVRKIAEATVDWPSPAGVLGTDEYPPGHYEYAGYHVLM
jgi:hypothetical protein